MCLLKRKFWYPDLFCFKIAKTHLSLDISFIFTPEPLTKQPVNTRQNNLLLRSLCACPLKTQSLTTGTSGKHKLYHLNQHQWGAASQLTWLEVQQAFVVKPCSSQFMQELRKELSSSLCFFLYLLLMAGGFKLPELSSLIITFWKMKVHMVRQFHFHFENKFSLLILKKTVEIMVA